MCVCVCVCVCVCGVCRDGVTDRVSCARDSRTASPVPGMARMEVPEARVHLPSLLHTLGTAGSTIPSLFHAKSVAANVTVGMPATATGTAFSSAAALILAAQQGAPRSGLPPDLNSPMLPPGNLCGRETTPTRECATHVHRDTARALCVCVCVRAR